MFGRKVFFFSLEKFPISTIKRGDAASDDGSDPEQPRGTWYFPSLAVKRSQAFQDSS